VDESELGRVGFLYAPVQLSCWFVRGTTAAGMTLESHTIGHMEPNLDPWKSGEHSLDATG